jgi:hypothetical protein
MKILMRRFFLAITIAFSAIQVADAQMLALKTNAAGYAAFAPNLCAELVTGNKTSFSLSAIGAIHSFGMDMFAFGAMPEFRYWFHGRPMTREFIGVGVLGATYKLKTTDQGHRKIYKGNVGGFGLTFGYVWVLGQKQRWNMELHGGLGMYRYNQQARYGGEMNEVDWTDTRYKEKGWVVLPYNVGLSFSYILPTEKIARKF